MRFLACFLLCTALLAGEEVPLPAGDRLQTQALAYAEAQVAGQEGKYVFKVLGHSLLPRALKGELVFEPAHLSRAELTGRFFASFNALDDGRNLGMVRVDLEGRWTGRLLRARAALPRRTVPTEGQVEAFDFEGTPPPGALRDLPEGFRVLVKADLEPVPLVNMGDPVRLELVQGGLTISVDALARSVGAMGDKVRLEVPTSHKMLQAVVTGPGEARLEWAAPK